MTLKYFIGELIGTFILVFLGCGSIAYSLFIEPLHLIEVALVWGVAVTLAIYTVQHFSKAHLNPAVSLGFYLNGDINKNQLLINCVGQFFGAFIAAFVLFVVFSSSLEFKTIENAYMFGEYYPNPSNKDSADLNMFEAWIIESVGTFLLTLGILIIVRTNVKRSKLIHPLLIGVLLMILIYLLAPFTQAGFNPARDFAPRLFSFLKGWEMAFTYNGIGWVVVYILGPMVGALLAVVIFRKIKKPPTK